MQGGDPQIISSRASLRIIGRAMRYSLRYKFELAVKAAAQMTSIFWLLILPWPGKLVIDYIVLGDKARGTASDVPFFFRPLLASVESLTAYQAAWVMAGVFLVMIVLIGAFGPEGAERDLAVAGLAEGEDTATRSENQANSMHSLVSGLFGLFEALWHIRISHRMNHLLRSELFGHFTAHRLTDYHDRAIGDVVYRAMYDTPSISNIVFNLWVGPATSVVNLATTILMMHLVFRSEPAVVWCALAVAPVNIVTLLYFANLRRKYGTLAREAGAATTAVIEEGMSNVLAVQGLGGSEIDHARFANASAFSYRRFRSLVLIGILGSYTSYVVGACLGYTVLWVTASAFIGGQFAPGDWWIIWGYYYSISGSSVYLGRLWLDLQENVTGLERVFSILDSQAEVLDPAEGTGSLGREFTLKEGVRLSGVDFDYPDGTPALRAIDFEGRVGEMVALVGPTGAGKTTLAYLIPALIEPTRGRYFVDGRELTRSDLAPLRRQVAFVFQETTIFDDTIEGNIRMGKIDATADEIEEAARMAGAAAFIEQLPQRYATPLGRAGSKLSVGQKQRLAIARALVSEKPILVLDEPTAALDPRTENELVRNLLDARQNRLLVVIAHRLSTIRAADRIYLLQDGRIAESGNHEELMAAGGTYADFVHLQTTGGQDTT